MINEDIDLLILSAADFDSFMVAFTAAGAIVTPYDEIDDGWRYWVFDAPGFPNEMKLAFLEELESGSCLPIKKFKPDLTIRYPEDLSIWWRYRYMQPVYYTAQDGYKYVYPLP